MAKSDFTRFICNYCLATQEVNVNGNNPQGWTQFASRQLAPTESDASIVIDLCPDHLDDFRDFLYGRNGNHRPRVKENV